MNRLFARVSTVSVLTFAIAAGALACSSPEATVLPPVDGWGPTGGVQKSGSAGGGSNGATAGGGTGNASSSGSPSGSASGSGSSSSGSSTGPTTGSSSGAASSSSSSSSSGAGAGTGTSGSGGSGTDAGFGFPIDSGAPGTPAAPSGPPGSCTNPLCATDGNECGCTATDSNGDTVQMGCQAGGQCICVVNQQPEDQPFDEDGACSDQASTAAQFLANCACQ